MDEFAIKRNFNIFVVSSAFSLLGIEIYHIALPLLALSLGLNPVQISWCVFAFYCPVIFVKIVSSAFIERKDKISTLKVSEAGRACCTILFIISLYVFHDHGLLWLVPASFLFGVFTVFTEVAEPVVIKNLIRGQKSTATLATYEIRTRGVQLLAPALCGYFISVSDYFAYYFILLLSFAALVFLFLIKMAEPVPEQGHRSRITEDIRCALKWLADHRLFSLMILLTAINNFLHPVLYLTVIWDLNEQNTAFEITGLVLSGLGVGGLIGSFLARKIMNMLTFRTLVLVINILRVIVFVGFIISASPLWVFSLFVFKAVLGGLWNVGYNVFTIQEMPVALAARISAISGTFVKLSAGLGSLLAGYLLVLAGSTTTLVILVMLTVFMLTCSFICKAEYQRYDASRRDLC